MHNFRKLQIWEDAMDLAENVYKLLEKFPSEEKFGLVSQIKRSVISIPSNIAEGAGRNSDGEFKQFLGIATASSYELETQLLLSQKLNFLTEPEIESLIPKIHALQRKIHNLRKNLSKK